MLALSAALAACGSKPAAPPAGGAEPEGTGTPLPASVRVTDDIAYYFDSVTTTSGGIQVDGWAHVEKQGARDAEISLVLRSANGWARAFRGWPVARRDVSAHFKNPDLDDSGFSVWIPRGALSPGDYQLGVYIRLKGRDSLRFTPQVVHVDAAETTGGGPSSPPPAADQR